MTSNYLSMQKDLVMGACFSDNKDSQNRLLSLFHLDERL